MRNKEIITVEISIPVEYTVHPGQQETFKDPGFPPEVEVHGFNKEQALKAIGWELDHPDMQDVLLELAERKEDITT